MSFVVANYLDVDQFEPGETTMACGPFAVALAKNGVKVAQSLTATPEQIDQYADQLYTKYVGPNTSADQMGIGMQQLFEMLQDAGLHYQVVGSTEINFHPEHMIYDYAVAWLKLGYPLIVSVAESSVYDLDLGGSPYSWDTKGYYHIISIVGLANDGNYLCHDTASIDKNGVRKGPRRYDRNKMQFTSITAVVLPWLPRPAPGYDPLAAKVH
jgi:hypothetical protein